MLPRACMGIVPLGEPLSFCQNFSPDADAVQWTEVFILSEVQGGPCQLSARADSTFSLLFKTDGGIETHETDGSVVLMALSPASGLIDRLPVLGGTTAARFSMLTTS